MERAERAKVSLLRCLVCIPFGQTFSDIDNPDCWIAFSRFSDGGEDAKVKGTRIVGGAGKLKNVALPLPSFLPFYFRVRAFWIGKFRIPRRPWKENDCEANAGQLLYKNQNKDRYFAAESLENDWNLQNSEISKLLQKSKLWEKLIVLNRRKKKATKPKDELIIN